jgi:IclR family transcriptional regulator, KDG regulon repressor
LATLQECEFVDRTPDGAYYLHIRFLEFGYEVRKHMNLVDLSLPVLNWLVAETGQSAFVSVVDGTEALCIAARESLSQIRMAASVGRRLPLYAGATPTILLAFMPAAKRDTLLDQIDLVPFTPATITDRARLLAYLEQIYRQGYVFTPEDLTEGAKGVGVPIRDFSQEVVASLSIAGIASQFTAERMPRYLELTLEGAAKISKALGYKTAKSVPNEGTNSE